MENQYRIIGTNDKETTCGLCGKQNLKRVVWLENVETGDVTPVGTTCAAKLRGVRVRVQERDEREFHEQQVTKAREELWPYRRAAWCLKMREAESKLKEMTKLLSDKYGCEPWEL